MDDGAPALRELARQLAAPDDNDLSALNYRAPGGQRRRVRAHEPRAEQQAQNEFTHRLL